MTNTISRYKLEHFLREHCKGFFSCKFVKKDHTIRKITAQFPKPLEHPKRPAPAKLANEYLLVRDIALYRAALAMGNNADLAASKSYRLINLATIIEVTINKVTYTVI